MSKSSKARIQLKKASSCIDLRHEGRTDNDGQTYVGIITEIEQKSGVIRPEKPWPYTATELVFSITDTDMSKGNRVRFQLEYHIHGKPFATNVSVITGGIRPAYSSVALNRIETPSAQSIGFHQTPKGAIGKNQKLDKGKHFRGIVVAVQSHYGFITPSETLPNVPNHKDIHFAKSNVTGEPVELHDEVTFELKSANRSKPDAINVTLVKKSCQKDESDVGAAVSKVKIPTKDKPAKLQLNVRGRLVTINENDKGKYGFVRVDKMPDGYKRNDVMVHFNKVASGGMDLVEGDELEMKLGSLQKDRERPSALKATLISCNSRPLAVLIKYLAQTYEAVQQFDAKLKTFSKSENLLEIITCHAPWEAVASCAELPDSSISVFLTLICELHEQLTHGFQNHFKKLLRKLSHIRPWLELLKSKVKMKFKMQNIAFLKKVKTFLMIMLKNVPEKARGFISVIEPLVDNDIESTEYFLFSMLKETAKLSSDNVEDMEWNELPLVPSVTELLGGPLESRVNLSEVKQEGAYNSPQEYIDTYFRLLREDCFSALRKGVHDLLRGNLDPRDMNVYFSVSVAGIQVSNSDSGVAIALQVTPYRKITNWATCSNLMYGNLLCISPSGNFKDLIWATVGSRDVKLLQQNQIILVELISECNAVSDSQAILRMEQCSGSMIMTESPTYYRAYQPVLRALQTMDPEQLPFKDELVHIKQRGKAEFIHSDTTVDGGLIYPVGDSRNMLIFQYYARQHRLVPEIENSGSDADTGTLQVDQFCRMLRHKPVTKLDASQEMAVVDSIKRKIAMIQGPPGTGKTYIGVKILQLLESMSSKPDSPILILTYKNHALDEFLKQVLELYPGRVTRVGGSSQDPNINSCNINALRRLTKFRKSDSLHSVIQQLYTQADFLKTQVEKDAKRLNDSKRLTVNCFIKYSENNQIEKMLKCCQWQGVYKHKLRSLKIGDTDKGLIGQREIQAICDKCRLHEEGMKTVFETKFPSDLHEDLCFLVHTALLRWLPDKSVFAEIEDRFATQLDVSEMQESSLLGNTDDISLDEKDIEEEERKRLGAAANQKNIDSENIVLFKSSLDWKGLGSVGLLSCMSDVIDQVPVASLRRHEDPWKLKPHQRALLVQSYLYEQTKEAGEKFDETLQEYQSNCVERNELELQHKVQILSSMKVIGMTITGASIHQSLLAQVKPAIVLVEEAAEVLEPQLLATLGSWTQQLILIGDHQQLRPQVENFELVKRYHFDISMMERLINNKFAYGKLTKQNRMRQEFAELLKDIYPELESNVERVSKNVPPYCVGSSLFFWDHRDMETDARSYRNEKEADRAVMLACFLVRQGYKPYEITILAAYQGQVSLIRKKMRAIEDEHKSFFEPPIPGNDEMKDEEIPKSFRVKVHTIDLYQGDENEIVIVSLVRSNERKKIGFLNTINRRCVAQSRAKCGMYFIGNAMTLSSSSIWASIIDSMEETGNLGDAIPLQCPLHKELSHVSAQNAQDIPLDAFCKMACTEKMDCGIHNCPKLCQPLHNDHSKCKVPVLFVHSNCGHECKKLCFVNPIRIECKQTVSFQFLVCGHRGKRKCNESERDKICEEKCPKQLPCCHPCTNKCGEKCNPDSCNICEQIRKLEEERKRRAELEKRMRILNDIDAKLKMLKEKPLKELKRESLLPVKDTASEYLDVEDRVKRYVQAGHNWYPTVTKIEKITNDKLEKLWYEAQKEMYDPKRSELKFHGTSSDAVDAIVEKGFKTPAKAGMFGAGIYFATDSSKSAQEMYTKGSNMLLLCDVSIGKSMTVDTAMKTMNAKELEKKGYDSLFAKRGTKESGGVVNDEYVIYVPARALPKYVIHYKKDSLDGASNDWMTLYAKLGTKVEKYRITPSRYFNSASSKDIHFRIAESQFLRLMQKRGGNYEIKSVDYYVNPPLVKKFEDMQKIYTQRYPNQKESEYILAFHGTDSSNIDSIVNNNFRVDKIRRVAYGKGIYFSEFPDVSISYGSSLLLCKVLPGKSYPCSGGMSGASLQVGYDSHIVQADEEGRGHMIVIFNPDQILPCYVINL